MGAATAERPRYSRAVNSGVQVSRILPVLTVIALASCQGGIKDTSPSGTDTTPPTDTEDTDTTSDTEDTDGVVYEGDLTLDASGPPLAGFGFTTLYDFGAGVRPVDLQALPDGRLLIIGLNGAVYLFNPATGEMDGNTVIGSWPADHVAIAVHPYFGDGEHDTLYVWRNQTTQIWRYQVSLDPFEITDGEQLFEATVEMTDGHSGGDLLWWAGETDEPVLYLTIGDGLPDSGQDDSTVFGALLAFAEGPGGELVPGVPDAPYANPYNVAIGVRNPWRLADCGEAICFVDVGRDDWEEFNVYYGAGANYGWSVEEGLGSGDYLDPIVTYHHTDEEFVFDDQDNTAPLGLMKVGWISQAVFTDNVFAPELAGKVLIGDHYDGWLRALDPLDGPAPATEHIGHLRYISSMAETADGQVFATDLSGTLRQLVRRDDVPRYGEPGLALSDTQFVEGGVEYEVEHPLWSNAAGKLRMIQVPDGGMIDNSDPDHWEFPIGTQAWKSFTVDDELVEVRVLELREEGWIPGVFIYEPDGEAYLTDGYTKHITTSRGDYVVPSISACEECHSGSRGRSFLLATEPFQLGDEGLDSHRPYLENDPGSAPIVTGDDLTKEVRGYLHGNCAYCHNPDGRVVDLVAVRLDLRYNTPISEMFAVNEPIKYHFQPASPVIIDAGDSEHSALVHILSNMEMPPLGLWEPDTVMVEQLSAWIDGLAAPPP